MITICDKDEEARLKLSLKRSRNATYKNWRAKQLTIELEYKLPNEFKGSIEDFNHRNTDSAFYIDQNEYNIFKY